MWDMQIAYRHRFSDQLLVPAIDESRGSVSVERQKAHRDLWMFLFGIEESKTNPDVDFEDWHESVAWLKAVIDLQEAGYDLPLYVFLRDGDPALTVNAEVEFHPDLDFILVGAANNGHFSLVDELVAADGCQYPLGTHGYEHKIAQYPALATFQRHAGRRLELVSLPDDGDLADIYDPASLAAAVKRLADAGIRSAFLKVNMPKYLVEPFEIPEYPTDHQCSGVVIDILEYSLMQLEGRKDILSIQEAVPMRDEYRIVIIDGKPVAGAGCIVAHTPCENESERDFPFDPKVEGVRDSGQVVSDPDLIAEYHRFAVAIAKEILEETGDDLWRGFVLDVARDASGKPLIVEINPLVNYGLYAMDTRAVLEAILHSTLAQDRASVNPH